MNNQDWNVSDKKLEKKFYFKNKEEAQSFVNEINRIAKEENHQPVIEQKSRTVLVIIPVAGPDLYEEKDIRLANLINRMAN